MKPLALALSVLVSNPASALECLHAKPRNSHQWASWRLIEGKRCWYVGHGRLPKSKLAWFHAPHEQAQVPLIAVPLVPTPQPRPRDTFEERWPR
jgi:hypothetical protein